MSEGTDVIRFWYQRQIAHKVGSVGGVVSAQPEAGGPFRGHDSEDQTHEMHLSALWRVSKMFTSMAHFYFC